jgi:RNA polymerase sigma factor (sigma-70 family)
MLTPADLVSLIAAVAKGDEAAFERLYVATRAKLYGVVLRILRRQELAEEIIQETYVKIWNSAGQFNPELASPITWMTSIARNRAIDLVRKKSEASIEEEPDAMEVAADSPDPLAVGMRRPARARPSEAGVAGLLQRLEPRAARREVRRAHQHHQDLAAPQPAGYPGVPWTLSDGP